MPDRVQLRDFSDADAEAVDRIALAAFTQFKDQYSDWSAMAASVSRMSDLSRHGEIVVAGLGGEVVGAVVYVPPDRPKAEYFDRAWPIIRMLVVDPAARGRGTGRALADECIVRAARDRSPVIALHTSPIMTVALPMYLRMGFEFARKAPPILGVPYAVYLLRL